MKTSHILIILLTTTLASLSCKKDNQAVMQEQSMTSCPSGSDCRYLFSEYADLNTNFIGFTKGTYRLFWSTVDDKLTSTRIYIKAPMEGNRFVLDKADILAERVKLIEVCAFCNSLNMKPVDGYVKGTNVSPEKRADQTKWQLEIKLYLESEDDALTKDTLTINQHFYPNFVYN